MKIHQAISVLVVILVLGSGLGCRPGFDRKLDRAFKSVRNGMSEAEVFALMGAGARTNSEFTLGQSQGNEKEYAKTNGLKAHVFYTWHNGIDWSYCVGFDAGGRSVVKGQGGT